MKKLALLVSMLVVFATGSSAWGALTGTMTSNSTASGSNGMYAINALQGSLTWSVDQLSNGLWDYKYVYTPTTANKNQGVGAISIQFGAQPTDLVSNYIYQGSYANMANATTSGTLQTIDRTLAGSTIYNTYWDKNDKIGTNVNVTTTFQGIQWLINNPANGSASLTLDLQTALAPVWGDFYMDGFNTTTNNGYAFVRNTGYDTNATQAFSLNGSNLAGYIPTPGAAAPVPIPPSVLLFGSGLSGLFFFRRKKIEG
jgi:hypothetical protein